MTDSRQASQGGNVLFYILIAIALIVALTFAVASSNRGSMQQVNEEKARILADDLLQYGNVMSNAVAQLRLRGCKDTEISFEHGGVQANSNAPADKTCHVFDTAGGGVTFRLFPEMGSTATAFRTGTLGLAETGLNTEADLWMRIIFDNSANAKVICAMLNDKASLGVADNTGTAGFEPYQTGALSSVDFVGTYPGAVVLNDSNLKGKPTWCNGHDTDLVSFHRLLISR